MSVEERLGRIEEKLDQLTSTLPTMCNDIDDLKEFKWKIVGAIGIIVPIYTAFVTVAVTILYNILF
jgi:hypothetical protein